MEKGNDGSKAIEEGPRMIEGIHKIRVDMSRFAYKGKAYR